MKLSLKFNLLVVSYQLSVIKWKDRLQDYYLDNNQNLIAIFICIDYKLQEKYSPHFPPLRSLPTLTLSEILIHLIETHIPHFGQGKRI